MSWDNDKVKGNNQICGARFNLRIVQSTRLLTSWIMSINSASVGFCPRDRMTVPNSLVVMVPVREKKKIKHETQHDQISTIFVTDRFAVSNPIFRSSLRPPRQHPRTHPVLQIQTTIDRLWCFRCQQCCCIIIGIAMNPVGPFLSRLSSTSGCPNRNKNLLTISVLVEKGEGLLEFGNLFFGKLISHGESIKVCLVTIESLCYETLEAIALKGRSFSASAQYGTIPDVARGTAWIQNQPPRTVTYKWPQDLTIWRSWLPRSDFKKLVCMRAAFLMIIRLFPASQPVFRPARSDKVVVRNQAFSRRRADITRKEWIGVAFHRCLSRKQKSK